MAEMKFTVNLLPNTTATYNLGSSSLKWNNIYGTLKGNADTATGALYLSHNNSTNSADPGGLTWFDVNGTVGHTADINDTPTTGWWYILRNRHTNQNNDYYTDIAIPFNDSSIYYKNIRNNEVINNEWTKVLDSRNYGSYALPLSGGTLSGTLTIQTATSSSVAYGATNPTITFKNSSGDQNCSLIFTDYDSVRAPAGIKLIGNQGNEWFEAPRVFGAVWNDYVEYRNQKEEIEPGYVVLEQDDGKLIKSTARLQKGGAIVSDTFGFAIGKTDKCKTPLAVSGRVLAYTYEPREMFHAGDAVCTGPDGKVSLMTEEEEERYPLRCIGIVSEIPDYETWGTGNVKVNNRIWIKVR